MDKDKNTMDNEEKVVTFEDNAQDTNQKDLNSEIKEIKKELEDLKESKLMVLADFDNYRKRTESDKQLMQTVVLISMARSIIEVVDDFERMISDLEKKEKEDIIDSFKPILSKLKGILIDNGITEISGIENGAIFNPHNMEAIGTVVGDESSNNKVHDVVQKGYEYLKSKQIVRHARVIVSKYEIKN